jgi:chromosome partition protein MukF
LRSDAASVLKLVDTAHSFLILYETSDQFCVDWPEVEPTAMDTKERDGSLHVIASIHRDGIGLDLKPVDLCFLVALHTRAAQGSLTCFEEEVLLDVFEQVCDAVDPDGENLRKRATHAIQRLREQRLLSRVDGAGIIRAGDYSMTRLASGIVEFFMAEQALTRESLSLLNRS